MAKSSSITRQKARAKPTSQPSGVRPRTMALILSVTEPKSWPGSMTGGRPRSMKSVGPVSTRTALLGLQRRVGVAERHQVSRAGARVQLAEQRVVALLGLQPGDPAVRIVDVAEDDRAGRTGGLA